ncbi:MAG: class I SAM-dependent methyltransferase [Chitinivibrionales bacterium]|nr:class I SAM-dependent methyltransferase [Chitinivibrionales bacterium]
MSLPIKLRLKKLALYHVAFKLPELSLDSLAAPLPIGFKRIISTMNLPSPPLYKHDDFTSLMRILCDRKPHTILELGTAHGTTTANFAANTDAAIYTVNALPEQIGGKAITFALSKAEIGSVYRKYGYQDRIIQIYENTLNFDHSAYFPQPVVDFAVIDACHDYEFIINDFFKVLPCLKPGACLFMHDMHPSMKRHLGPSYFAGMRLRRLGFDIQHIHDTWWGYWVRPEGKPTVPLSSILMRRSTPRLYGAFR